MIDREKLREMLDEGLVSKDIVIDACINWMTSDEIDSMCKYNGIQPPEFYYDEEDED